MDIINDPLWKPSLRLSYNKFTSSITLGPFAKASGCVTTDHPSCKDRWRWVFNEKRDKYDIYTKIFTSDIQFIKGLMQLYPYTEVQTPMNEYHNEVLLQGPEKISIRPTLWHKKYKYRVESYVSFYNKNKITQDTYYKVCEFIDENFKGNSYIRNTNYGGSWNSYNTIPYVYTNNEGAIMLFKMMFNNIMNVTVTEAITFDDIKEKA